MTAYQVAVELAPSKVNFLLIKLRVLLSKLCPGDGIVNYPGSITALEKLR
jgi:hypothetical protein